MCVHYALCQTAKRRMILSLLSHYLEFIGSFKVQNLARFFDSLIFGEPIGYGGPRYRISGHLINASSVEFIFAY